jgi:hypothetical protein
MRSAILIKLGGPFEITGFPKVYNVGDTILDVFGTVGGTAPITWTCTSLGSSGATFSAGVLSGTAANGGVFPFTLTAVDANRQVAHATFNLIISGASEILMADETLTYVMATESGAAMIPQ